MMRGGPLWVNGTSHVRVEPMDSPLSHVAARYNNDELLTALPRYAGRIALELGVRRGADEGQRTLLQDGASGWKSVDFVRVSARIVDGYADSWSCL